jgi:DNA-directed RNA polymerase subunit RPC12/RpoP
MESRYLCSQCKFQLELNHKGACPNCGGTDKYLVKVSNEEINVYDGNVTLLKQQDQKRPILEMIDRVKNSRDPKAVRDVREIIKMDRKGDWYDQTVENLKTGEIIHPHHGRLSEHKTPPKRKMKP